MNPRFIRLVSASLCLALISLCPSVHPAAYALDCAAQPGEGAPSADISALFAQTAQSLNLGCPDGPVYSYPDPSGDASDDLYPTQGFANVLLVYYGPPIGIFVARGDMLQ